MKLGKLFILCINQKKSLKKYTITQLSQYNEIAFNYKNRCYIYKLRNCKTSEPHILILKVTDKLDWRRSEKIISLLNLRIYNTWKNIKNSNNHNKFKISAPTWNDKFELPDGSYSVSNILNIFWKSMEKILINYQ